MAARERIEHIVISLRKKSGVTQEDLASRLGVTRQTIIAIEGNKYTPSLCLAIKIAKYFSLAVEDIFQLVEE